MLTAISPIDGRYAAKTQDLSHFFSEFALIKYRVLVEVQYFTALVDHPLPQLADFPKPKLDDLLRVANQFSIEDAERIKALADIIAAVDVGMGTFIPSYISTKTGTTLINIKIVTKIATENKTPG